MRDDKAMARRWMVILMCMVFWSPAAPVWAQSSGGEGPHLPGDGPRSGDGPPTREINPWMSGGGIIRSGRFPDKCSSLSWQVEKGRPHNMVSGLPDPIYLELCNCRIGSVGTNNVLLTYTTTQGGPKVEYNLRVGQCVFVAATDMTITGAGLEAYGTHEIVTNPRQTITVIEKDGD